MARQPKVKHSHVFAGQRVTPEEREQYLIEIFRRLAPNYDRLLDVQSLGLHRYWRRVVVREIAPRSGQHILDVAGGCGEMAKRLDSPDRQVIVLDASIPMINAGRTRSITNIEWVAGLAQALPFPDASMDTVVCAFGIRNVTYVEEALREILRVLKPGARFFCLEVSLPWAPILPLFRAYCRYIVPRVGTWVTRAPEAYEYLVDSILEFPDRTGIKDLFEEMGFTNVRCRRLTLGIACMHVGTKPC